MQKSKLLRNKANLLALLVLVIGVVGVIGLILFPKINPAQAASVESDIEVTVDSVIAMSLTNCDATDSSVVKVEVTPSSSGTFKSNCQTATVHTNAPGYTLTAKSSSTTLNYLNPTTITPLPTIPSTTAQTTTPATLIPNTWGFAAENRLNFDTTYAVDNASNTFAALPTTDTTVYSEEGFPISVTDHTFYYGTNLNTDVMAGTYAATVTYTAVGAEVLELPTMQNFAEVCYYNSSVDNNIGTTRILPDTRNGQKYRVRCMEDAKWWMIDNMKLDDVTLTSTDSNVSSDYYLIPIGARGTIDDTPYVDDPTSTSNSSLRDHCINNTAQSSSNFTESYSPDSQSGCGYLYSWSAATAGTGNGISSGNATGSICPVGWHLPTGTSTGEFAVLNGSMLAGSPSAASITTISAYRANWSSTGPFSGSYAGNFNGSTWGDQGNRGRWWSSTASSATNAYYANVNYYGLGPGTSSYTQYYGLSVRCLL